MLMRKIDSLREKSESHRKRFAFGISFFVTLLIFVSWVSVIFPNNSGRIMAKNNDNQEKNNIETPVTIMKESLAQVFSAIKGMGDDTPIDLNQEYEKIKGQVENGDLQIIPESYIDR